MCEGEEGLGQRGRGVGRHRMRRGKRNAIFSEYDFQDNNVKNVKFESVGGILSLRNYFYLFGRRRAAHVVRPRKQLEKKPTKNVPHCTPSYSPRATCAKFEERLGHLGLVSPFKREEKL